MKSPVPHGWYTVPLVVAAGLSVAAIAGWCLHIRVMVQILSGPWAMVLSTAAGCLIASLALLAMRFYDGVRGDAIAGLGGVVVLVLGLLGIAENIWHRNLGLDFVSLHQGLVPGYGPAGRMGLNTGITLAFFGVNLLAYAVRRRQPAASVTRYLLVAVFVLATTGVLTRWLDLSDLFVWYYASGFNRMSQLTAATAFLIGIAMWQLWEQSLRAAWTEEKLEGTRILQAAAFSLALTAIATGVAGIVLLQSRLMNETRENLEHTALENANSMDLQLTQRVDRASILSNQATVAAALQRFNNNPGDARAAQVLRISAAGLLKHGFRAVEFQGAASGSASAGDWLREPLISAPITAYAARLLWKDGYFLETRAPVIGDSGLVGYIRSLQPLPGLNRLMTRANRTGRSGEMTLCAAQAGGMFCFPNRLSAVPFFVSSAAPGEQEMVLRAVRGAGASTITEVNGRRVLVAYEPVGTLGFGLAIQMDTVEILQPARRGLEVAAPLIVVLIGAGFWAMNRRIHPLIQKLISSREHIRHLATHDALTDLPNRALLEDRFGVAGRAAHRTGVQIALIMVDLDHFKQINDRLGHAAGDLVLVEVAKRLRRCVRETDTVARFGGDEFVLLINGSEHPRGTALIAEKILAGLNVPMQIGGNTVTMTPSLGIAGYPADGVDLRSLLQHADIAMYEAKNSGRNGFRIYAAETQAMLNMVVGLS